jgi:hypothetical protein
VTGNDPPSNTSSAMFGGEKPASRGCRSPGAGASHASTPLRGSDAIVQRAPSHVRLHSSTPPLLSLAVTAIRVSHTTSLHDSWACCTQASDQPVSQQLGTALQTVAAQPSRRAGGWPAAHRLTGVIASSKQVLDAGPE